MAALERSRTAEWPTAAHTAQDDNRTTKRLPLYLLGGKRRQVDIDGPSLLLRQSGAATMRFPLVRLSRILSGPKIHWSASALSACLDARIPIVFIGKVREPIGYLLPVQAAPSRLNETIQEYLSHESWESGYRDWLRSERMRLVREWCAARVAVGQEISRVQYRELVHEYVYAGDGRAAANDDLYRSAVAALVIERLMKSGLSARYWSVDARVLELGADITNLLEIALRLEMRGMGAALRGNDAALMRILHSFGQTLEDRCVEILGRLHRNFRERLEQWR